MNLDREIVRGEAVFRRPCLGDRREQAEERGTVRIGLAIDQLRTVKAQRQRAFGIGLLGEQHLLDVGMLDDRHRIAA